MATDAFTGTALATTAGTSATILRQEKPGTAVYDRRGFYIHCSGNKVTVTKATAFGGTQAALSFPITRDEAHSLALHLLELAH